VKHKPVIRLTVLVTLLAAEEYNNCRRTRYSSRNEQNKARDRLKAFIIHCRIDSSNFGLVSTLDYAGSIVLINTLDYAGSIVLINRVERR